ncbi:fungal hydrophobin [Mycena olivaceomarginata]|nr:fungal hydrophobin [Mycena olivaceomarginata]
MFPKLSLVVASVLIVSSPLLPPARTRSPSPPRSSQCCKSVVSSTSAAASAAAALVGIDLTGLNVPIGLSCSPITVAGNNCGSTTVTCDAPQQQWAGAIAINCLPIIA